MGSMVAAGTSYSTHGEPMIPIYIFYSMFGFQRTGDAIWALGDQLGKGFLLGATAGRTTLNGEGLQHQDGHSLLLAATNPAVLSYDPAWAYEVAVIVEDALRRMYGSTDEHPHGEDIFYYLTVYNEPYRQPAMPEGIDIEGIKRGIYRYAKAPADTKADDSGSAGGHGEDTRPRAQILASGVAMLAAIKAQAMLAEQWGVAADVWSVTSWTELRRDAVAADEAALLDPGSPARVPYVTAAFANAAGPAVAVSDWMRAVPDQISRWMPNDWSSLGTDGFGRSDTRGGLRRYFHVDAESVTVAVLTELARRGEVKHEVLQQAIDGYRLTEVQAASAGNTGGDS
jgi:pyruvate dehydrogenase E1 component